MKKGEKFGGEFTPEQAEAATQNQAEKTLTNRISELLQGITTSVKIEPESGLNLKNPGNITRAVDRISEAVEAKTRGKYSIMQRIRNLPAAVKGTLAALVLTVEAAAAQSAFPKQEPQEQEYKIIQEKKHIPEPTTIRFRGDHVIVENDELGLFLKHNIRRPESLADIGKMFVEPLSFGIKFRLGKNYTLPTRIVTGPGNEFVFEADIPYEYARDFKKANPVDQKKMEADMEKKARGLIEKILTQVIGLSFYKDEARNIGRKGSVMVSEVKIDGFASPESDRGINTDDPRNIALSEMRAENAAYVLQRLFENKGIEVAEIKYRGRGEMHLSQTERKKLLQDAAEIKIGSDSPEEKRLLELVRRYNDGVINREEIKRNLDQIIGGKRKVAINVTTNERNYVLILPLPLLLPALLPLLSRWRNGYKADVYAEFIPGPEDGGDNLNRVARDEARQIGRNIRQDALWSSPPRPLSDVVKGYSATDNLQRQYAEEVVRSTRHWRKRGVRQRIQLDLEQNMPLASRVGALAFIVDRYLRMTPTLANRRSILGRGSYDLVNIYRDREALQALLNRIARTSIQVVQLTQLLGSGEPRSRSLNLLPPPNIPQHGRVVFEFNSAPQSQRRGTQGRREAISTAGVWVNRRRYPLDLQELQRLANAYIASRRIV